MKTLLFLSLLAFSCLTFEAAAQEMASASKSESIPQSLEWETMHVEMGKIQQNEPATTEFKFTNSSEKAVVIKNIKSSCGCTAANHSQQPVLPGETSKISVKYNAKKVGAFRKSVTVETGNGSKPVVLVISGKVV